MTINQFISKKECLEAIKNIPKKYSTNRKWNEYLCENIIPRIDNSFFEDENFANKVLKIPYELSDLWIVDDYSSNKKNEYVKFKDIDKNCRLIKSLKSFSITDENFKDFDYSVFSNFENLSNNNF